MRTTRGFLVAAALVAVDMFLAGSLTACSQDSDEDETDRDERRDAAAAQPSAAEAGAPEEGPAEAGAAGGVTIRWWGQACMSVETDDGQSVLVDPFPEDFGYESPTIAPQVCLVSHEHSDHNAVDNVQGSPEVIREVGEHRVAGMTFRGIATYHDDQQGASRGANTVFVWEMAGVTLSHLGDLGHLLTDEQLEQIGPVDVAMIPVGGVFTIDAQQAVEVALQLSAEVVLPMHYGTEATPILPLATIDDFLAAVPEGWTVERPESTSITLSSHDLPQDGVTVVVLNYE